MFSSVAPARAFNLLWLEGAVFADATYTEEKKLPPVQVMRSQKIDVKHIAINLSFDWTKKQAYGTTAITFAALNSTNKITLDAAYFIINSIKSQNGASLKFEYDKTDKNDNLKITLDRTYQAGEDVTVKIDYRTNHVNPTDPNSLGGNNIKGLRFSEPTSNDPGKPREIWSMGDPESNRYWFPSYDSPNDFRTTEFTATVDKKLTVISNGKLVETKENADGTRTFHWKMDTPYANHLTSFVVGEYVDVKQVYEGIELHNYGYPHETEWVQATVERLPDMVKFFSEKTGVKYPYQSYSQVFVQDLPNWSGNSMTSTITENMVDDASTHADFLYLWDLTEGEALAHQWFGNYLTSRDWSHIWLNKAFARYFSGLYTEYKNGHDEFQLYHRLYDQGVYLNDWNSGNRQPVVNKHYEDVQAYSVDNYPYFRGALVLHILRKHLGEENWWKTIRNYVKSNANKSVSTEDFRKAIEETTGESMEWFFDQWLYKMGHPVFVITKTYDETKKQLTLNVKQTQKIDTNYKHPQIEYFQGKVEIEIDDRIEQVRLEPKAENIFTFASSTQPKLVNFDYESTWIKEIKFEKSLDEILYQLQNDKDILAGRAALNELINIARDRNTTVEERSKIYAAFRNTISGNSYWRLRLGVMQQFQNLVAPATVNRPIPLDEPTVTMLLSVIKNDKAWTRAGAIGFLGMTRDERFVDIYINALNDPSDRVINSAAIALGKSKSPKAFDALAKLVNKPSMKSQSMLCALSGLKELGDPRGFDIAFKALSDLKLPRWRLLSWDFRVAAADTIAALGKGNTAYPLIFERFKKSMAENDIEGIFYNVLLISKLSDPRGQEAFDLLKVKFKNDANAMQAVNQFETQFKESLKR